MKKYGQRYKLNGASQYGKQWDKTNYLIEHGEIVERAVLRVFRDDLFRVDSNGVVISIDESIIERYFDKLNWNLGGNHEIFNWIRAN